MFLKALSKSVIPALMPIVPIVLGALAGLSEPGGAGHEMGGGLFVIFIIFWGVLYALGVFVVSTLILYFAQCSALAIKWIYWTNLSICSLVSLLFIIVTIQNWR